MDSDGHGPVDAFAILGLPRELEISGAAIEEAWRELSRELHPDADTGDAGRAADVNRAKDILGRPSTRLRHWLELRGVEIGRDTAISNDLMDLFGEVGGVLREADGVLKDKAAASSALGKALLAEREIAAQQELQSQLANLQDRKAAVTERFSEFQVAAETGDFGEAIAATGTLGFLEKWEREIQERLIAILSG